MGLLRTLAGLIMPGSRSAAIGQEPVTGTPSPEAGPAAVKDKNGPQEVPSQGVNGKESETPPDREGKEPLKEHEQTVPSEEDPVSGNIGKNGKEAEKDPSREEPAKEPDAEEPDKNGILSEKEEQGPEGPDPDRGMEKDVPAGEQQSPAAGKNLDDIVRAAEAESRLDRTSRVLAAQAASLAKRPGDRMIFIDRDGKKLEFKKAFNHKKKRLEPAAFLDGRKVKTDKEAVSFIKKVLSPGSRAEHRPEIPAMGEKEARGLAEMAKKDPNAFNRYSDRNAIKALIRLRTAEKALSRSGAGKKETEPLEKVMGNIFRTHPSEDFRKEAVSIDKDLIRHIDSPTEEVRRAAENAARQEMLYAAQNTATQAPEKRTVRPTRTVLFCEKEPGREILSYKKATAPAAERRDGKAVTVSVGDRGEKEYYVVTPAPGGDYRIQRARTVQEQHRKETRIILERQAKDKEVILEQQRAEEERAREEEEIRQAEMENGGSREEEAFYQALTASAIQLVTLDHLAGVIAEELGTEKAAGAGVKEIAEKGHALPMPER